MSDYLTSYSFGRWVKSDNNDSLDTYSFGTHFDNSAVAAAPEITVTDPADQVMVDGVGTYDFGTADEDNTNVFADFVVTNDGDADLVVSSITVPAEFAVRDDEGNVISGGFTLEPDESITMRLRLLTETLGSHSGTFIINSNDADEGSFEINVQGLVADIISGTASLDGRPPVMSAEVGVGVTITSRLVSRLAVASILSRVGRVASANLVGQPAVARSEGTTTVTVGGSLNSGKPHFRGIEVGNSVISARLASGQPACGVRSSVEVQASASLVARPAVMAITDIDRSKAGASLRAGVAIARAISTVSVTGRGLLHPGAARVAARVNVAVEARSTLRAGQPHVSSAASIPTDTNITARLYSNKPTLAADVQAAVVGRISAHSPSPTLRSATRVASSYIVLRLSPQGHLRMKVA